MPRVKAWVRVLAIILVAVPVLLVAAYFIQVAILERRLVAEANATVGSPHPRPVHVDSPVTGTFGEALSPYLRSIEKAARAYTEDEKAKEVLQAILRGDRPLADVPARVLTDLEQLAASWMACCERRMRNEPTTLRSRTASIPRRARPDWGSSTRRR